MTRKVPILRHSDVTNLMSHLARLPEREKSPGDTINLSEVCSKAYMLEIKAALKKGYSFGDLAEIFSERCGVSISERQLKYHYTRQMNLRAKGKKSKSGSAAKEAVSPAASQSKVSGNNEDSVSNVVEVSPCSPSQPKTTAPDRGAFPIVNRWKSS